MMAIINERQLTPDQVEEVELRETYPQKYEPEFDPLIEFKANKQAADPSRKKTSAYRILSREETADLLAASKAPFVPPPEPPERKEYKTYTREQVEFFMRQHFQYLEDEKRIQEERAKWDSPKTTGYEPKTEYIPRHSTSTKD